MVSEGNDKDDDHNNHHAYGRLPQSHLMGQGYCDGHVYSDTEDFSYPPAHAM